MLESDRRAAVALKTIERPDVRALRSGLERLAKKLDDLVQVQDEEIQRLRRLVVQVAQAYRLAVSHEWKRQHRNAAFFSAVDQLALESDAIVAAGDLRPGGRPARRVTNARPQVLGGDERREGPVDEGLRPEG